MRELTKRQSEIYDYIKHIVQTKGYPPSVREIGEAVGLASSSTVHGHLSRLEEKVIFEETLLNLELLKLLVNN
ncbi:hypothetical protein BN1318_1960004 [Staphylococcus capitis]|nr:hypothetical protein BN1318_1960004 [Staphylococcus capitis]